MQVRVTWYHSIHKSSDFSGIVSAWETFVLNLNINWTRQPMDYTFKNWCNTKHNYYSLSLEWPQYRLQLVILPTCIVTELQFS